jgi:hypothetical protein
VRLPLAKYIVDVSEVEFHVDRVDVTASRDELFRCLKNVISLICGVHPCVLEFKGWSIRHQGDRLEFVTMTGKHRALSEEEIGEWDTAEREKFVIGIAVGISHLHSLGIFHDNFKLSSVCVGSENWGPRICGFGLSETDAEFRYEVDSLACRPVFVQVLPANHPWREHCEHLKFIPKDRISLQEFIDECMRKETTTVEIRAYKKELESANHEQRVRGTMETDGILFDLLGALCDSQDKWTAKGGEVDVARALFELIPDRDPVSETDFRGRFDNSFREDGTLRRDLLADF